jgi:hypothetical protein
MFLATATSAEQEAALISLSSEVIILRKAGYSKVLK